MPSSTCAYCGRFSHMTLRYSGSFRADTSGTHVQGAFECDNCNRISVASRPYDSEADIESPNRASKLTWQPRSAISPLFPDVPSLIARAATEAHESNSINALMAAILMARTVVEATAKDRGIVSGRLVQKIDAMKEAELIRTSTAEAAHEIRHFGNDMAHGDLDDLPSAEDADEVLTLMNEVLNEVYQGPARTARIKSRRVKVADAAEVAESIVEPNDPSTTMRI